MVPRHNFHIYGACRNKGIEKAFESYHTGKGDGGRKTRQKTFFMGGIDPSRHHEIIFDTGISRIS